MTWKIIPFARDYEASDDGQIRKVNGRQAGIIMRAHDNGYGYLKVKLVVGYQRVIFYVHRIVCHTFHGAPPDNTECRHLDGDARNNVASNLKWGSPKINARDKRRRR